MSDRATTRLDARPVVSLHDWSYVQSYDWRVLRSPMIVQDRPRPIVRRSYYYVRPVCDRLYDLRSQQQVFLGIFKNLFATDFDSKTVHDHHDYSCTIYLRSSAIWLFDWSYINRNLVARPVW